jgi:hypothetical protein
MKLATGGWVCKVPDEVAFIEFVENEPHTRASVTFYDEHGKTLPGPKWETIPEPAHWTARV